MICRFAAPKSPLARAMHPSLEWGALEYMTAGLLDLARFTFWRESDPVKRGQAPEAVERPGLVATQVTVTTVDAMTIDEALAWMVQHRKGLRDG